MSEEAMKPGEAKTVPAGPVVIRVESGESTLKSVGKRILIGLLVTSIFLNLMFLFSAAAETAASAGSSVQSSHHSGTRFASDKLAVISFSGTIMPPFTERWLSQIEAATEDDDVKGVLLAVDSPGGLVADSHQIYHKLEQLRAKKPIYVAMQRLAASGGYYLAMGIGPEGKIFVEPTTWTGSIGVIIPRYNATELATKVGVKVEPLTTGPLKDSLNPFRDLSEREVKVWDAIMDDSFNRFVNLIAENRAELSLDQVKELATGQIYTANQALDNGLVDEVGYVEDALAALATDIGLTEYEAVKYSSPQTLMDVLLNGKAEHQQANVMESLLEATVPKAMYYCSWNPWVPGHPGR